MAVPVASSFCCTKEQAEPGQSGLSGPGLAPGLARQEPGFALPCPALPYSQYLAQLSIFVRIPCLSSSAFHVIFSLPELTVILESTPHGTDILSIVWSTPRFFHFVFECTSLQGQADFVWSVKRAFHGSHAADDLQPLEFESLSCFTMRKACLAHWPPLIFKPTPWGNCP